MCTYTAYKVWSRNVTSLTNWLNAKSLEVEKNLAIWRFFFHIECKAHNSYVNKNKAKRKNQRVK